MFTMKDTPQQQINSKFLNNFWIFCNLFAIRKFILVKVGKCKAFFIELLYFEPRQFVGVCFFLHQFHNLRRGNYPQQNCNEFLFTQKKSRGKFPGKNIVHLLSSYFILFEYRKLHKFLHPTAQRKLADFLFQKHKV